MEDVGCPALLTLIGQELECAKQIVREQKAKIADQVEADTQEIADFNKADKQYNAAINNYIGIIIKSWNEEGQYRMLQLDIKYKYFAYLDRTETERFKCYLSLSELESNSFCAIKHIRSFMKDISLNALGLTADDVEDCQYADFMREGEECLDINGKEAKCIEGDIIPTDVDKLPKTIWTRDALRP